MVLEELLKEVIAKFDELNIPYALTGAIGSSYYGQPRTTHDFDLVINLIAGKKQAQKILNSFHQEYYVSEEAIIESVVYKTMFNMIHHETGLKIDCWILKDDDYNQQSFARRKKEKFAGKIMFFLAPEDLILNKLLWYKAGGAERQLSDIRGILAVREGALDLAYIKKWAAKLKVHDILSLLI
jgi:hypothetical protein